MFLRLFGLLLSLLFSGCSNLENLTKEKLHSAEETWKKRAPGLYRMAVEMSGERIESGLFEVIVRSDVVVSLKRNGLVVRPGREQDYSMEGLFSTLWQELELSRQPKLLGAPSGFSAHLLVRFDNQDGGIRHYRRVVGGNGNSIEIRVLTFDPR